MGNQIMADTIWSFIGEKFRDRTAFSDEVREYHLDIDGEDSWKPEEVVLDAPRVQVAYEYWDDEGEELEALLDLTAANAKNFTALDLLFQLHNATVEHLRDNDHHFFEGLDVEAEQTDGVLRATLWLGS